MDTTCVIVLNRGERAGDACGRSSGFAVDGQPVCRRHLAAAVEQAARPWCMTVGVVPEVYDDESASVFQDTLPVRRPPRTAREPGVRYTDGGFVYRQAPHPYCGSSSERQSVGDPGHCEDCCAVGHLIAHPDYGCSDVGCYLDHGDDCPLCTEPVAAHTDRGLCPVP